MPVWRTMIISTFSWMPLWSQMIPKSHNSLRRTIMPCSRWFMTFWSGLKNKVCYPAQLDLSAATWGYLSFMFALQYRARANIFEEYNEQTIREINRLWLQALRTG